MDMTEQNKVFFKNGWLNMAGGCYGFEPPQIIKAIHKISVTGGLSGLVDPAVEYVCEQEF